MVVRRMGGWRRGESMLFDSMAEDLCRLKWDDGAGSFMGMVIMIESCRIDMLFPSLPSHYIGLIDALTDS